MKGAFPLPAPDVSQVLATLGVTAPPLARPTYALDQILAELIEPGPRLRRVKVPRLDGDYFE